MIIHFFSAVVGVCGGDDGEGEIVPYCEYKRWGVPYWEYMRDCERCVK